MAPSNDGRADISSAEPLLIEEFLRLISGWSEVFPQERTFQRARDQALGGLLCMGRRTLTRILWTNGREQMPWAADYHLHSRCQWEPQALFAPIWREALPLCRGRLVGVAFDDTRLPKTGRCIRQAFYQRDPLSPPFHVNLMLGLRFLQASLLVPGADGKGARALPVRFEEAPRVKKPGKKASPSQITQWKQARKLHNLSSQAVGTMQAVRLEMDAAGGSENVLVMAGDGSFCNKTCFAAPLERTELLVRCRTDASLCFRAPEGGRRFYAKEKFTPEQVRHDHNVLWHMTRLRYGGKRRKVRYKEVRPLYWQGGAKKRPLRLIVVAPTPYRKRQSSKLYYRKPAYLLTTDLRSSAAKLVQIYFDRWEIEINHREEKDTLGVGQAQLWNVKAVPRQPVLAVAAYSALLLASLKLFDGKRSPAFAPLPAWRPKARRPSCLDLLALLRKEATTTGAHLLTHRKTISPTGMVAAAAA
jgi:hypothetical protein